MDTNCYVKCKTDHFYKFLSSVEFFFDNPIIDNPLMKFRQSKALAEDSDANHTGEFGISNPAEV